MTIDPIESARSHANWMIKECMRYTSVIHLKKRISDRNRYLPDGQVKGADPVIGGYVRAMYHCFWEMRDLVARHRKKNSPSKSMIEERMNTTGKVADDVLQSILTDRISHHASCRPSRKVQGVSMKQHGPVVGPMWLKMVHEQGLETPDMGKRKVLTLRVRRKDGFSFRHEGIELFEADAFKPTRVGVNLEGYVFRVKAYDGGDHIVIFNQSLSAGLFVTRTAIRERVLKAM